jgi:predicted branched-subunit amino acid permease
MPFALVIGSAMGQIGIPGGVGFAGGAGMYSGSAQLAAVNLLGAGADLVVILAAVAVINARLLVYGAALEARFRGQPWWFRWFGPHFIVDQTYAMATRRSELDEPGAFRRYWLTAGVVLGFAWMGAMMLGMALGGAIPASSPLNFAATAVLIAIVTPRLRAPRSLVIAGVAAAVAIAGSSLPNGLGLAGGMVAGITVGMLSEVRQR